jgi:hypothetical protein
MRVRFMVIATAALTIGAAAVAEPTRPASRDPNPPAHPAAEVVLASAEQAQAPAPTPDQPSATPVKHRAARVTTCRCGDQVEQPNE